MKKNYTWSMWLLAAILMFTANVSRAQLVNETFTYADGNLVGNGTWAAHGGAGSTPVQVSGGKIVLTHGSGSREDVNIPFTEQTSGTVYASFDFSVDNPGNAIAGTDYEYFAHFGGFKARMDIVSPTGANGFSVGISSGGSTAETTWATDFTFGTTYKAVISYNIGTGQATLWIDPTSETSTNIQGTTGTGVNVSNFSFRQSNSQSDETVRVDNLLVGTTFSQVTPTAAPAVTPTNHVTGVNSSNVTVKQATINWTDATGANLPTGYLVQIKKTGVGSFPALTDGVAVSDDIDFSDNAGVVSIGQGTQTSKISGLTVGTSYEYRIIPYGSGTGGPKYKTDGTIPSGTFTTKTSVAVGVVKDFEDGSLTSGDWSVVNSVGAQVWTITSSGADGSSKSARISGFDGSAKENTDWLISPPINFDATLKEQLNFFAQRKFGTTGANDYLKVYYSTDYSGAGDPSTATLNELTVNLPTTADVWESSGNIDLSAISGTAYIIFQYKSATDAIRWDVDQIKIEIATILTTTQTALSGFGANAGTASAVQTFDLTGATLNGDVTVTAPTGYEVSVDGGTTFGSPKTIAKADVDGKTVTVQVRLSATAAEGAVNGDLTITSTGATDKTVALTGLVAGANTPIISKNGSFTAFTNEEGTASASQNIKVSGSKLTADITATAPTGFEVSLDDATFSGSVTLTQTGGNVTNVTVYVRVAAATAAGSPNGNLALTSTGATQLDVAVSGTVTTPVPVKTIKQLREAVDANGLPTTTGKIKVKGIVYGGNTQTSNIALTIIEGTNAAKEGIGLFISSSSFGTLGLANKDALVEGDQLEIEAEVGHFNGLMQLTNVSKVTKLSGGNALQAAAAVTTLGEDTESRLIKFENISVKDRTDWAGNASYTGSGFNVTVLVGGAELTVRVDGDTELAKKTYDEVFTDGLTSGITIVGLGGQFDSSDPRDGGYQLAPWKAANITVDVSKATPIAPTLSAATDVSNSGFTASWTAPAKGPTPDSYQLDVATDEAFTSLVVGFANLSVSGTTQAITGLSAGTKYYVRVRAVNGNGASNNSNVGIVTTTGTATGVDPTVDATFKTFPNPNPGSLVIESNTYKFSKVVITTLGSKMMVTKNLQGAKRSTIDLSNLSQGVYLVQIFDNNGKALSVRRIVKR